MVRRQALRTLGRCYLLIADPENALAKALEALNLAGNIGDRQAICESRLIAAEAHLLSETWTIAAKSYNE